jgi:hypothetical protein
MLQNTDKVRVENRANAIVCYRVPESKVMRRFVPGEAKEIEMGELRQAIQIPGTFRLIESNLIIHNKEAVDELLPNAEPEYFYDKNDVDFLLERGTLDQLKDALDFAPDGVIELIKERAVKNELNDMRKREAILTATNFNVTQAIDIVRQAHEGETVPEVKARRATPLGESDSTQAAPVRRTAAPKYTVVK